MDWFLYDNGLCQERVKVKKYNKWKVSYATATPYQKSTKAITEKPTLEKSFLY